MWSPTAWASIARASSAVDVHRMERCRGGVHTLCGTIVAFASRAPAVSRMTVDQTARVHSIRLACRAAVDVGRDVAGLQPNASRHMNGENPAMRLQYAFIRRDIARCLRQLAALVTIDNPVRLSSVVEALEHHARRRDALADGTIHRLLRGRAVTPALAATLMIDSGRALAIERGLVAIAACIIAAAATPRSAGGERAAIAEARSEASWSAP
jgi:hypothetical protein